MLVSENLIGKGGSSRVYRGYLPDGKELAVKNLKPSEDVLQEFVMEIQIITSLHHKNIISLFGFCFEDSNLLLVYDLLSRGSLEENLHGIGQINFFSFSLMFLVLERHGLSSLFFAGSKKDPVAFGWSERFKVALGVAEALYYLHNHNTQPIIHRDVKSSNILLSEDFEPQVLPFLLELCMFSCYLTTCYSWFSYVCSLQLSDFGFAKLASTSSHITCTDVAGTFGSVTSTQFVDSLISIIF